MNSNNYKLLKLVAESLERTQNRMNDIYLAQNLETATGYSLTLFGKMFDVQRNGRDDTAYRAAIKNTMLVSICTGQIDSVKECIAVLFGVNSEDIVICEGEETDASVEEIYIKNSKYLNGRLNYAGRQTITSAIKSLLPIGISIANIVIDGTFEYNGDVGYDEGSYSGDV
jgi:hypothetical protein